MILQLLYDSFCRGMEEKRGVCVGLNRMSYVRGRRKRGWDFGISKSLIFLSWPSKGGGYYRGRSQWLQRS